MAPSSSVESAGKAAQLTHRPREEIRARKSRYKVLIVSLVVLCAAFSVLFQGFGWVPEPIRNAWSALTSSSASSYSQDGTEPVKEYLLGVGKADITGPVVEINLMGYAKSEQVGTGLRQRLYARSFIIGDPGKPEDRFVYVVLDTQSGDTAVRYGVIAGLQTFGPGYAMYGHNNIAITGTHSHSGPGAWVNYLLPQITSRGLDKQSYHAIVDGCLLSIRRAHEGLELGTLGIGRSKVFGASINRSLFSYMSNPEEERLKYNISAEDDGSVDKEMTLLNFERVSDRKSMGILTWFPTHGTSMLKNNTLISGDNKGVAADLFEKAIRVDGSATDDFVAGFSQANMGDVSPNVLGAWCEDDSGEMCDFKTSTCSDGKSQYCQGRGPRFGQEDYGASSCFEIGKRQYEGAMEIYQSLIKHSQLIRGPVKAIHAFHDMSDFQFTLPDGREVETCPAALGYSFAAGTSDGAGTAEFTQHESNSSNTSPLWRVVSGFLKRPGKDQKACQHPKPILLDVGEVSRPYAWTPNIVDIQTFRVGQLAIIVSPGEATTMAGRRWKEAVQQRMTSSFAEELGDDEPLVVLGAPANSYTHYITTEEEYSIQRYEGASTLYGPHTLAAYIDRTLEWLPALAANHSPPKAVLGPLPPDNTNRSLSFINGVVFDGKSWASSFGQVKSDVPDATYRRGDTIEATFIGANPRNNLRLEQTYAAVEYRSDANEEWKTVRDDSDWTLLFQWRRLSAMLGTSEVEIKWEIEEWTPTGEYRLRYFGDFKSIGGTVTAFEGSSSVFRVAI